MNRRRFFKWLGAGTAAVVVAPAAILPKESHVQTHPWDYPAELDNCSCSGRSFWEGPCDWCSTHSRECGCPYSKSCTCTVLGYADYSSFSSFALSSSIDESITNVANEMAHRAGRSVSELREAVNYKPVVFGRTNA